ncbi:MAG: hypothetical protein M3463_08425 [Verrucomicrobiota bacterium]|nr:hypothetical protein [Verrucomicrobiota bacterium]
MPRLLLPALLLWLSIAAGAGALEVRQTLWGFDGRVVPGRMSPFSVLLANPGNAPFDGEVVLRQLGGLGGHSGAPYVQAVYLAPRSERWVQFHAFMDSSAHEFALSWGRGAKERVELDAPAAGPPARVLLSDPDNPFAAGGSLKVFPDQLFPTTVAATDSLDAVALDYAPRWEPARREAFLDWLRRGGLVLVLASLNGEFPVFGEQLDVLNFSGDSARVGAGTVLRAKAGRRQAGEQLFAGRGFPAPELKQQKEVAVYQLEQTLFERLARMTRPNIHWWLINTLTAVYLLIIGPAHYRWGRKIDYRLSILAFLGTVALFGWLFSVIGRRGYGESQTVHSLAIARSLGAGRHDVTQWISAFATRGDLYTLTHRAPANLYAAVSMEAINGQIVNGKDGRFIADIPLYSSRQFVHRAALPGDDPGVTIEAWEATDLHLQKLVLQAGPQFPKEVLEIRARFREGFFELQQKGDRLVLPGHARRQTFGEFLPRQRVQTHSYDPGLYAASMDGNKASLEVFRRALPLLYVRAMNGHAYFPQALDYPPMPGDVLELYVFARAPESFGLQGKGFARENGFVLYVQKVFKP